MAVVEASNQNKALTSGQADPPSYLIYKDDIAPLHSPRSGRATKQSSCGLSSRTATGQCGLQHPHGVLALVEGGDGVDVQIHASPWPSWSPINSATGLRESGRGRRRCRRPD